MLWVALLTFPLMAAVQEICDRTALATGKGLGELIFIRFSKAWRVAIGLLIAVLIIANSLNIAADLVAVGAGMHLLHAGPEALWALVAGVAIIVLLLSGSFPLVAKVIKVLCAALLAYVVELFFVTVPWGEVVVTHGRAALPIQQGLRRHLHRGPRHDHLALPLLLAEPGATRGPPRGDRRWQQATAAPTANQDRRADQTG